MAGSERVICSSADLTDSGDGVRFELEVHGRPEPAFAVRYKGRVYAYLNRCAHMPMELDWKPGKFFDVWGLHLICSTHGATYAPDTGRCLRGPCFQEGIFFKLLGFAYLTLLVLLVLDWRGHDGLTSGKHTALVDVVGVIDPKGDASADRVTESLQNAFKNKNTQGVILRINSPGGSPVQAGIIYDEIRRLRGIYPNVPMYAVVEDICASGGYYIAAAADRIYVDKASIIGSIGVIMDGWGFTGTMEKLGVERRALTSGENKAFLDPFSPVDEKQKRHAQSMLDEIHAQFIDVVKKGRGKRLKESPDIF